MENEILTLGSASRSWREFISILSENRVELVGDVRRFPKSKFDHFRKENLEPGLESEGISYEWLGEGLGGFRRGGYDSYSRTPQFREAIDQLEQMALDKRVAVMCCEKSYKACHRRFIALAMEVRGWRVVHIQ